MNAVSMRAVRRRTLGLVALMLAGLSSGCALMSKGEPVTPRYFTPLAEPSSSGAKAGAPASERAPSELRLGQVEPAAHLDERIAYRVSDAELAYYADQRWTEPPEALVRRALERELFERRGLERVVSGAAPTLDIDVLGFEELREPPARARVSMRLLLHDDRRAQLERTVTVDVPLADGADRGPALARAMAEALSTAARQVADLAITQLDGARASVATVE